MADSKADSKKAGNKAGNKAGKRRVNPQGYGAVPHAELFKARRVSAVWVIPIVAVLLGAWLTYRSFTEKGPVISITFRSAEGLETGKTRIKYRDLEMGIVESLKLAPDLSHVVVTAQLAPGTERYLTDGTRFWVVRARVSAGQVSGLGTLLSGAYIGIDPVAGGEPRDHFEGLEVQPLVTSQKAGRRFVLRSPTQGSVEVGSPVYYRQVRVGEVIRTELHPEHGEFVSIDIWIDAPYHRQVHRETRFWNASGFEATLDDKGVRIETESFVSMLIGGVAFETPEPAGPESTQGDVFPLYPSRRATSVKAYTIKQRFLVYFDGSVRGLVPGAAVEFRGIQIGQVADVRLEFDAGADALRIPVVIEVEPERIEVVGEGKADVAKRLIRLVDKGLRAQLESGNLLTGRLIVGLDFHPDAPPAVVRTGGPYPELPTVPTKLAALTASLTGLLRKLDQVPMKEVGAELASSARALRGTLDQTRRLARSVNENLVPRVGATIEATQATLVETQATLKTAQDALRSTDRLVRGAGQMVGPGSPVNRELQRLMAELVEAARSIRLLADHLERNPEDLVRGRSEP